MKPDISITVFLIINQRLIVLGTDKGTIEVYDMEGKRMCGELEIHKDWVVSLDYIEHREERLYLLSGGGQSDSSVIVSGFLWRENNLVFEAGGVCVEMKRSVNCLRVNRELDLLYLGDTEGNFTIYQIEYSGESPRLNFQ